jgi:uncharacterized membrane protein
VQRGLALDPDPDRRIRRRRGGNAGLGQPRQSLLAARLGDVDPQVERRRPADGLDPGPEGVAEPGLHPLREPLRKVVAERLGQGVARRRPAPLEPGDLGLAHRRSQESGVARPGEQHQPALELAAARTCEVAQQRQLAQDGEHGVGQDAALARSEHACFAKEFGDDAIGGMLETQDAVHEIGRRLEQGVGGHRRDYPRRVTRRAPPPHGRQARPVAALGPHYRLLICAVLGALAGAFWPVIEAPLTRALVGWSVATWSYLGWTLVILLRADAGHIKRVALAQSESAGMVLAILIAAVVASLVAVTFELVAAKAAGPGHVLAHGLLAAFTVVGSWLMLPVLFALSYAAAYFSPEPDGGLQFPGAGAGFEPDHTDFLYFAFTVAVTAQTSDVAVSTRPMRRLVLAQSILSFAFNTTILAFSINAAASFF